MFEETDFARQFPKVAVLLACLAEDNNLPADDDPCVPTGWSQAFARAEAQLAGFSSDELDLLATGDVDERVHLANAAPDADLVLEAAFDGQLTGVLGEF